MDLLSEIEVHPAAELFPLLEGEEFDQLAADIAEHGQRDAIVLTPEGQLLDGRNRWRACRQVGAVPITRVENAEPWAFVVSTNLHRRHLNPSQLAMVAARWANRRPGRPRKTPPSDGVSAPTHEAAARALNVGESSVVRASKVLRWGTTSLQDAVDQGQITVAAAARAASSLDDEKQDQLVHRIRNGADATKIAPRETRKRSAEATPAPNRTRDRHRTISVSAVDQVRYALDALGLVLDNTPDGLDPSITNEQAGHLMADLSKSAGSIRRLNALLKARKESTT